MSKALLQIFVHIIGILMWTGLYALIRAIGVPADYAAVATVCALILQIDMYKEQ